ncbi:MAG: sensor histidine kinase [Lawsonibacter sp.]|jgi:signal transduction histidine kinase
MRKRLFFFHTITLIGAMAILLVVNGAVVHWVSNFYRTQLSSASSDPRLQHVQTLLEHWDSSNQSWMDLEEQLREYDYNLTVTHNGTQVFSQLNRLQEDVYQRTVPSTTWPESGTLTIQTNGVSLVGRQAGEYVLIAIPRPDIPPVLGRQRPQDEAMMLSIFLSGMAAIGIIVLFSLFFSRYQIKRILRPVNALTDAARRVEAGDLSTPVDYQGQDEFSTVCTAFDHMQRHLLQERERNVRYEQARTDLVAGISHDLRTPLTSVKGYIKGLRDGVAQTPEKQAQYLDIAYRKACDMDVLLQRLFYFSKLETGNLPFFPEPTDLGAFVLKFAAEVQGELSTRGGTLQVSVTGSSHPVSIDTEQMYRVLSNLTENAIHYAQADPLQLTLSVWQEDGAEHLCFADNGVGVNPEQMPHLFDQFWRGDQARGSQSGEGSGLGLYIVKFIVEAHGGTIHARQQNGLVFDLTLPCNEVDEHA